ncbi:MAG TPA: response regulator [Longimicrobiales bacterium]|nr:response regulator [Longimicrobiales bacterium]
MRRQHGIVLVFPDDETRVTLEVILKREGWAVFTTDSGPDALELIHDSMPVLVITEMRLPRGNGLELIRTVRSEDRLSALRIIATGEEASREEAVGAGADLFVAVPAAPHQLARSVVQLVGRP